MELTLEAWVSQAVYAAAELGIADALARGPLPLNELANRVGADADALKRLMLIIHDWPDEQAVAILRNVHAAAGGDATVLLIEMVLPDHDRDFPGNWADLEMLLLGSSRERTAAEYRNLLGRAGLRMTRVVQTASPYSVVEAKPA